MKNIYRICLPLIIALFCLSTYTSNAQVIRTIAGDGVKGYVADGGMADTSRINNPMSMVVDKAGNVFFVDQANNRIREIVRSTGKIITVAGTGASGAGGTGAATGTTFNNPTGIALDTAGNIYIADAGNHVVRKILKSNGTISNLMGDGSGTYLSGQPASNTGLTPFALVVDDSSNVYVSDTINNRVFKIYNINKISVLAGNGKATYYKDGGKGDTSSIFSPCGVALDKKKNLYFADSRNNRIRKVLFTTNIISTVGGTGVSGYYYNNGGLADTDIIDRPMGLSVDTVTGNIYLCDVVFSRIREINATTGILTNLAGLGYTYYYGDGMEASDAGFENPNMLTVDDSANVYIADFGSQRIRKIFTTGPSITSQPTFSKSPICNLSAVSLGITVNGTGTTYQWWVDSNYSTPWVKLSNSGLYSGVTTDSLHISQVTDNGNQPQYRCTIDNGYDTSNSVYLNITDPAVATFTAPTDSICPGTPTTLIATVQFAESIPKHHLQSKLPSYNGVTYQWSTGDSTDTIHVSPLVTTNYVVTVNSNGCPGHDTITVDVDRTKVTATAFPKAFVCKGADVTLYGGGTNGSYSWSGGSGTVNNGVAFAPTATGIYTVTGIDSYGCILEDTLTVTVHALPSLTVTVLPKDTICAGSSITLTGNGTATYSWSGGITNGVAFTPAASAIYYLTGTGGKGCSSTVSVPVVVNTLPVVTGTAAPNAVCKGASVVLSGNGASSYLWTGGASNNVGFVPLASGSYTVTGTDVHGCVNTADVTITVDPLPAVSASAFPTATLCQGSSLALFGAGAASYAWTGGVNNGVSFTPSSSASYTVTGIDANGCKNKDSISIIVHHKVVPTVSSANTTCGLKNGSASVSGSNGISPYSYSWSTNPASSNSFVDSLAAGTYVVTVSDSANCASSAAVSIGSSTAPVLSVSTTNSNCGFVGTGSAIVTVAGGTAPYRYIWNNGDTLATNYNLKAATYIITVTDINGCSSFAPAIVTNLNGPKITTLAIKNIKCNGLPTGAISVSVSLGTAPYHYLWSTGATTSAISSLFAGPYQLTVVDADSCTSVENFTITQPLALVINSSTVKADCGSSNGSATITVTGGLAPFTYKWATGSTTNMAGAVAAGVYYVAVTDNNGCLDSSLVAVSDKTGPALVINLTANASCHSGGTVSVSASGGTSPYTYLWNNGVTASAISNVPTGNYYVNVTDAKGCISAADTTVSEMIPNPISLCMVTVDPVVGLHNYIIWDKSLAKNIKKYFIYKESTQAGVYFKIDSVPVDSAGIYVDLFSDATVRSWRYKISQADSCGNESPLSPAHKTMHLTVNQGLSGYVNLIWDDYEGLSFGTYYIYRDTNKKLFTRIDSVPSNIFTYTDKNPLSTTSPVYYRMGISNSGGCSPAIDAVNYNSSKSNSGNYVFNATGIPLINNNTGTISIFPNPSTGVFTVALSLDGPSKSLTLQVINTLGQVISTSSFSDVKADFNKQIDLSSLAKGLYFIKASTDHNTLYNKVVIQ